MRARQIVKVGQNAPLWRFFSQMHRFFLLFFVIWGAARDEQARYQNAKEVLGLSS